MLFIVLTVSVVIVYYATSFKNFYRKWKLSKQFPGPPALPILGNILDFFNKTPTEVFESFMENFDKYGSVWRLWLGPSLGIIVTDPRDVEAFLSSPIYIDKSKEYEKLAPWLNSGLLLSTGKKWHQRRKIITPAFHFKILEQFIEVFDRQAETFIGILKEYYVEKDSFEFYPLVSLFTLDVICETAMGTSINAQKDSNSAYVAAVQMEAHIIHSRAFHPLYRNNFIFKYSYYGKMEQNSLTILHGFTNNVIQNRRQKLKEEENSTGDNEEDIGIKKKEAFLDVLLNSTVDGRNLLDEEIREEVDTFMFEGHDTTTSAITFCLYNLAKYKDVQKKCYQEIIDVIGDDKSVGMSYTNLSELNYLEKVIKETLRLFPSVPQVGRYLKEDAIINGKIYPAGCNIAIQVFAMGRNPKYFKDPEEFRPERFDKENLKEFNTFAYVPFSAGPRNCIGQKFAMMELKSVLSKILRNFELHLVVDKKLRLYSELILRPTDPINFRIVPRT